MLEVVKIVYKKKIFLLLFFLFIPNFLGYTVSFFTRSSPDFWYLTLIKPAGTPPGIVFSIIWTILYSMIGVSFWLMIYSNKKKNSMAYIAFFLQLLLNYTWPLAFFYMQSPLLGLINIFLLLIAIFWTITLFYSYSKWSAFLLIPYFLWVLYASYLNFTIWYINN
jgi:benzodiazapine receptor